MDNKQIVRELTKILNQQGKKKGGMTGIILTMIASGLGIFFLGNQGAQEQLSEPETTTGVSTIAKGQEASCEVQKIYDGDTITALCNHRLTVKIRMSAIDAPEMGQKPWGQKAKETLTQMLNGKRFTLKSEGTDRYQRTLGYVWVNNKNINLEMVKTGDVVAYADKGTPKEFKDAEAQAKSKRKGVWSEAGDHQDPKSWRKYQK